MNSLIAANFLDSSPQGINYDNLNYYALLKGQRGIQKSDLEDLDKNKIPATLTSCARLKGHQKEDCLLEGLGYPLDERTEILSTYEKYNITVLDFSAAEIKNYEALWADQKYSGFLNRDKTFAQAVLKSTDTQGFGGNYDRNQNAIYWSSQYNPGVRASAIRALIRSQYPQLSSLAETKEKEASLLEGDIQNEIKREMTRQFLHENAHAVDLKCIKIPSEDIFSTKETSVTPIAKEWLNYGWTRTSGHYRVYPPLKCEKLKNKSSSTQDQLAKTGPFDSFYATVNPKEDFADSVAAYLTNDQEFFQGPAGQGDHSKVSFIKKIEALRACP